MKLYVLVRKDLSSSYRAVQGGHVLAEWLLKSENSKKWNNGTLIYLSLKDKNQLECILHELRHKDIDVIEFKEPDMDNEITAIASLGSNSIFEKLPLL